MMDDLQQTSGAVAPRGRRNPGQERLGTGVRIAAGLSGRDRQTAALGAWAEVLPRAAVFTSLTALAQHGLWLPPMPADLPIFVAAPASSGRIRRPELRVVRRPVAPASITLDSVPVEPVPDAILAAAADLHVLDLVVLIDSALHLHRCTLAEIELVAGRRRRGAPRLRTALPWCDCRAESPWETLLRLLHHVCDVPVEPQAEILAPDGSFVARADLLITGSRVLQEYDGSDHLVKRRYRRDRRRDSRLTAAGYVRHGYVDDDVLHKAVRILREADLALGRPHDPARIRGWHAMLRTSLFTPAGQSLLRRRWQLALAGHEVA